MRNLTNNAKMLFYSIPFTVVGVLIGWALNRPVMYAISLSPASVAVISLIKIALREKTMTTTLGSGLIARIVR